MKIEGTFLRSGVARRFFTLFIISALIPVVATAVLTLWQVSKLLISQSHAELGYASRNYGQALIERLTFADSSLKDLAQTIKSLPQGSASRAGLVGGGDKLALRKRFRSVALVTQSGEVTPVIGAARPLPPLTSAAQTLLQRGQPVVLEDATAPARIILLHAVSGSKGELTFVAGEIDTDCLFGDKESYPYQTDYAVLSSHGDMLGSSRPLPPETLDHLRPIFASSTRGAFAWHEDSNSYQASYWALYLEPQFHNGAWTVIASQPDVEFLTPMASFRDIFLPVIVLTVLLVGLLSTGQIRRTLVPLETLIQGTRRIAKRDFRSRVELARGNEFGELAEALNSMSDRLCKQFDSLATFSEIDRVILSKSDMGHIAVLALARIPQLTDAAYASITVVNSEAPERGLTYFRTDNGPSQSAPTVITSQCASALLDKPRGLQIDARGLAALAPGEPRDAGLKSYLVLPIIWKDSLSGLMTLGYSNHHDVSEETIATLQEFADRIGVGVASAVRDEQLYHQAHFDTLTSLPNRFYFKEQLAQEITLAQSKNSTFAVLFIDLDQFKKVNDSFGHRAGDRLLQHAAERLKQTLGLTSPVARLGGDEFTVILPRLVSPTEAGTIAHTLMDAFSEPFEYDSQQYFVSASVGIAIYPTDAVTADDLLRHADTAMYSAKQAGGARFTYFEDRMNRDAVAWAQLERELRRAIKNEEFEVHYQPQIDLRTGAVSGAEALVRWRHPERGLLGPAAFIGQAEEMGLISAIGDQVLRQTCRQLKSWQTEGIAPARIAVNFSSRQFHQGQLLETICTTLADNQLQPSCLEMEITESLLMDQSSSIVKTLEEIRALGVRIAIDDFGTGYSSMAYLRQLPVDVVKIDRTFVDGVGSNRQSEAIVIAMMTMAHVLGKDVVAEGIETEVQRNFLRNHGCEAGQGYLMSKPLPAIHCADYLRLNRRTIADHAKNDPRENVVSLTVHKAH